MRTDRFALVMLAACAVALSATARSAQAEGSVMFGNQWWTQTAPEAKFQEFRDVPRGPILPSLVIDSWGGPNLISVAAERGLQKDQSWKLMWASGARFSARVGYAQTPHRFSSVTSTPFTEIRPGDFVLPDSLQLLIQNQRQPDSLAKITRALTDAVKNGHVVPLDFQTNVTSGRVRLRPHKGWMLDATGRQTVRTGRKAYGAFIGTSPGNPVVELWEPIDQVMTDGSVRADFQGERVSVQVSGGVSIFDNKLQRMIWDNARRLTDTLSRGPGRGQLALAPDNSEVRGSVAAAVKLPRSTILTGTAGVGRVTQNQEWLPVTINSALNPASFVMPSTNTGGRADVINLDARLTSTAVEHVRGTLRYHQDKYDNKTPEWIFPRIANGDVAVVTGPVENIPFGHDSWLAGADLDWDAGRRVAAGLTAEYRRREHTHREVDKDKETVIGGRVRVRPTDNLSIDARARYGDRTLDEFHLDDYREAGTLIEQPDLRRPDVANRQQITGTAGLTWSPIDRIDLSATYNYVKNDYKELRFGLLKDEANVISTQGTVHATKRLDLRGGYGYTLGKTRQQSKQGLSGTIQTSTASDSLLWSADIEDLNVFVSSGFDLWVQPEKFSIVADYEFSRDLTDFDLVAGPGFTSPFLAASNRFGGPVPSTLYRRHDLSVEARYRVMKTTELSARYLWEEFDVIDFATKGLPLVFPDAVTILLGDFHQDYRAHQLALMVRHSF